MGYNRNAIIGWIRKTIIGFPCCHVNVILRLSFPCLLHDSGPGALIGCLGSSRDGEHNALLGCPNAVNCLVYRVPLSLELWLAVAALRDSSNYKALIGCSGYHVTVILNPVSSGGKGRKLYEEYCAPLLHLAGFKASLSHLTVLYLSVGS
jgi:hypothetical protein